MIEKIGKLPPLKLKSAELIEYFSCMPFWAHPDVQGARLKRPGCYVFVHLPIAEPLAAGLEELAVGGTAGTRHVL